MASSHRVTISGRFLAALCLALLGPCATPSLKGQNFAAIHQFSNDAGHVIARPTLDAAGRLVGVTSEGGVYGKGSVYRLTPTGNGGWDFATLYSFTGGADGSTPASQLVLAPDGTMYGVTTDGGDNNAGTVFSVNASGTVTTLDSFLFPPGPPAGITLGSDGNFYGASPTPGSVFRIGPSGTGITVIHTFGAGEGQTPQAPPILGSDGNLYGTTYYGGTFGSGTVYQMTTGGSVTTLYSFGTVQHEGTFPFTTLLEISGQLYGTTSAGTLGGHGSVFVIDTAGDLTTLHLFDGTDGTTPGGVLILASDGLLYGSTSFDGPSGGGTVFHIDPTGSSFATVHSFSGPDGNDPIDGVTEIPADALYGGTYASPQRVGGTVFRLAPSGDTLTTIHDFAPAEGHRPGSPLITGSDGLIYGTAGAGGPFAWGTAFRMEGSGTTTNLHAFTSAEGTPIGKLFEASDGSFYGAASMGGVNNWGTVYRMNRAGAVTVLHTFGYTDGANPDGGLADGGDGYLYGSAQSGGAQVSGVIYRVDAGGNYQVWHTFQGPDGAGPTGTLVMGSDGAFYGTTASGGASGTGGTVFRLDSSGTLTTIHSFDNFVDGMDPLGSLLLASDGLLYGTTQYGNNGPIIFRIDTTGASFDSFPLGVAEGAYLNGDLAEGPDGSIYGTAPNGGATNVGTIFRLDPAGTVSTAHSLVASEGDSPLAGLLAYTDGSLYGVASMDGSYGGGAAFRYTPGNVLSLFSIAPTSGAAAGGDTLTIDGYPVGGGIASTVTIGGVAVSASTAGLLTVVSPSLTPGTLNDVKVTNPGGAMATLTRAWLADFLDVPQADPFHAYVGAIAHARISVGCGSGLYCRDDAVSRDQMAVFLLKADHGASYVPPPCAGIFQDVACPSQFADWIEQLYNEGITAGCDPINYCPHDPVTRAQMAVFILKIEHGSSYAPPSCVGLFGDVPCPSQFAAWIEQLFAEHITGGCGPSSYCPDDPNTRGQMAVFLTKVFRLGS